MILRPYQDRVVNNCDKALNQHGNTLLVSATGTGKTVMLSSIAAKQISSSSKALIVAHRDELTRQNSDTFRRVCPDASVSFFDATRKSWRGQAVFSMVQTLSQNRNLDQMQPVDLLIYDEAHHCASLSYRKITARARELNNRVRILGVTATPERSDKKGLKETFSNVADIVTIGEMVRAGHLVPPRAMVVDIGTQEALKNVKKSASDYDMAEVEAIQNTTFHNKQIVDKWLEVASDRATVVFCATIQHAEDVRNAFREAGIHSEAVHGNLPVGERRAILKAFDRGEVPVLTNPMLLTEGWDSGRCACVVLLRTSSHKSTMIQMVGRGLRKADPKKYPGFVKKDCVVLDFGISLLTHGDLEAEVRLKFDRQADKETENKKKQCPECSSEMPMQARVCPICQYSFRVETDENGLWDELAELRLIEIDLLNKSPFKWISLFESERVLISTGFTCWASVCTPDNENWYAVGGIDGKAQMLGISNKIGAISSADDFMRKNESSANAKKAARWLNDYATQKQMQSLSWVEVYPQDYGKDYFTKAEAAAHLTFRWHLPKIEKAMGLRR